MSGSEGVSAFIHQFVPAEESGAPATLLLLHGTGGSENDLLELGRTIAPTAALLSPRGKVLESGLPRYFRRLAPGVFDRADLEARTHELAAFVEDAALAYHLARDRIIAVGYSNGANIAASLLLLRPEVLAAAILFRAMVPLVPATLPRLDGKPIFLGAGRRDQLINPDQAERLKNVLAKAGAAVTVHWEDTGHGLTPQDIGAARNWFRVWVAGTRDRSRGQHTERQQN